MEKYETQSDEIYFNGKHTFYNAYIEKQTLKNTNIAINILKSIYHIFFK